MFNTSNTNIKLGSNTTNVQFNTPSTGMMQRSHPKSRFIRFQKGSDMEKLIFPIADNEESKLSRSETKYRDPSSYDRHFNDRSYQVNIDTPVTILQILIFGADQYLCEVVKNSDLIEEQK